MTYLTISGRFRITVQGIAEGGNCNHGFMSDVLEATDELCGVGLPGLPVGKVYWKDMAEINKLE